jgi:hypothetical protein
VGVGLHRHHAPALLRLGQVARWYFDGAAAAAALWARLRPQLSTSDDHGERAGLFLARLLPSTPAATAAAWLPEMLAVWQSVHHVPQWDAHLLPLFARCALGHPALRPALSRR